MTLILFEFSPIKTPTNRRHSLKCQYPCFDIGNRSRASIHFYERMRADACNSGDGVVREEGGWTPMVLTASVSLVNSS